MTFSYAVNCSILFTEMPLEQRAAAAKQAGFDAIEFWWPWTVPVPPQSEIEAFVDTLMMAEMQLIGLNFWAGDMAAGDRGMVCHPDRAEQFAANVELVMDIAKRTGCKAFNALYGNRPEGVDEAEQDRVGAANLAAAARAAAAVDGIVLLEPISGAAAYPWKTADATVAFIDRVTAEHGVENIKFLFDAYHLAANGDDVFAAMERHYDRFGHVQIADNPGRNEPGTGRLDLTRLLSELEQRGWDRYVALEYKPLTTSMESFGWLPLERRGLQTA